MEGANNKTEALSKVFNILHERMKKKQSGNRRRGPQHGSREGGETETDEAALLSASTTAATTTTTTTTTTTEAPRRHPKAPQHSPSEIQYTVDGGRETTRTIVDFFPDLPPVADGRSEAEATETHMEGDQQTSPEETQQEAPRDSGRRKRRKKKKKTKEPTVVEEEPTTEYVDEAVEPQDYQNYLYGLENPEDDATETEGVEDLFPDGLPEGYPTDRFRADGNYSQNTR